MSRPLRVFILEDVVQDAVALVEQLRLDGFDPQWQRIDTEAEFQHRLSDPPEVILANVSNRNVKPALALDILRQRRLHIPLIVIAESLDRDQALAWLQKGATDYIIKDHMVRLGVAINNSLVQQRLRQEMGHVEARLQWLSQAVQQSPVSIVITDLEGNIQYVNPKFTEMTGYTVEEALGQNPRILKSGVTPKETYIDMWETLRANKVWRGELINRKKSGELFWEAASLSCILDERGATTHYLAVKEDITERRRVNQELLAANEGLEERVLERTAQLEKINEELKQARDEADLANHAKSEFLSRMSHELRTPLNAILGFGQLLTMQEMDQNTQENVQYILKGGRHLLDLINEVLDLARIEAGRISFSPEPVPVWPLVQETFDLLQPLAAEHHIQLINEIPPSSDFHVIADQQRLRQLLINLLNNAIKYNREGGQVYVSCAPGNSGLQKIPPVIPDALLAPTSLLRLTVRDTGSGLTQAQIERLFIPFERLHPDMLHVEGTGIGLTVTKRLVEAMNGRIGVESSVGVGSSFWVELPEGFPAHTNEVLPEVALEVPHQSAGEKLAAREFSVLYIEDNWSNMQLMKTILHQRPHLQLLEAMRGRKGVEMARELLPDAIILDLHLPDINGEQVLAQLRLDPTTNQIPVLVLSADAMPTHIARLKAAGVQHYLTKPLNVKEFLGVLDQTLGQLTAPGDNS